MDQVGDPNTHQVEHQHGSRKYAHRQHVGGGGNDRGDDENEQDRVADILPQPPCGHQSEKGQKEDQDRELKGDSQTQDHRHEEFRVLAQSHHRPELSAVANKEVESARINIVVAEKSAGKKKSDRGCHEGQDVALFLAVEAGRDEQPNLVKDERRGQDGAPDEADLDKEIERVDRVQIDQMRIQIVRFERGDDRLLHERKQLLPEAIGNEESNDQVQSGMNNAFAQFLQVLQE